MQEEERKDVSGGSIIRIYYISSTTQLLSFHSHGNTTMWAHPL